MKESTLLKVALFGSLVGLLILFIVSSFVEVPSNNLYDNLEVDSSVKLSGVVNGVRNAGSVIFIDLVQLQNVNVTVFDGNISLNRGDYIEVSGTLEEYEGKVSLVSDEIILK